MTPDETNPEAPEVETPTPATVEPEPAHEEQPEPNEDGEDAEEFEDLEFEGKTYSVPKAIKDGVLRHADYTRKTQEVAQTRKEIEAERARVAEHAKVTERLFEQRADLRTIDRELEQINKVDWRTLEAQDPVRANNLTRRMMQLQSARAQLAGDITSKEQELTLSQEREFATLWEQGHGQLRKQIPNWSPETANKLGEFATAELGYQPEQLKRARPNDFRTLYLASVGLQFLTKSRAPAPQAPQEAPAPVTVLKPRGNPRPTKEPTDRDSPEEWVRKRNAQLAARGR